jgi:transcriptional regulator with XRE-family HTH domain
MRHLTPLSAWDEHQLHRLLAARVKLARERLGLSQRELARIMQRCGSWIREIESGAQYAPPYLIVSLAGALGVQPGWFYRKVKA